MLSVLSLQVWFSSCWSYATQKAFQEALLAVLRSHPPAAAASGLSSLPNSAFRQTSTGSGTKQPGSANSGLPADSQLSSAVLRPLQHWQQNPDVPLSKSRSSWLKRITKTGAYIGGFKRQHDRLALAHYTFTGALQSSWASPKHAMIRWIIHHPSDHPVTGCHRTVRYTVQRNSPAYYAMTQ
jgi:hypothetical protein